MKTEILDLSINKHNYIVQASRLVECACENKDGTIYLDKAFLYFVKALLYNYWFYS